MEIIDDLMIIAEGGSLLFSWHGTEDVTTDDDLVSGFLSAIDSFATSEKGEALKVLKLDPTIIIFDKAEELNLKFIITTKINEIVELLNRILHETIELFTELYRNDLKERFDGRIDRFREFKKHFENTLRAHGLDNFREIETEIQKEEYLKSVILLDPNNAEVLYIKATHYVNIDKLSFFIPLILNTIKIIYEDYLKQKSLWVLVNSLDKEILLIEPRDHLIRIREYYFMEEELKNFPSIDLYKNSEKYSKKEKAAQKAFNKISWPENVDSAYLLDLNGKILQSREVNLSLNPNKIPEIVSLFTSSKKSCLEIYSKELCYTTIRSKEYSLLLINFNKLILLITVPQGIIKDFEDLQQVISQILKKIE